MQSLNFEKIDFESVLKTYNINNIKKRGNELQFSCPFPEHDRGDRHPSSSINCETGAYRCWGCKRQGNLITLVAEIENIDNVQSVKLLAKSYGGSYSNSYSSFPEKLDYKEILNKVMFMQKEITLPEETLKRFEVDWAKPFKGIQPQYLKRFNIGHDVISNRITIPLRNRARQLVGFKARALDPDEEPRYITLGDKGNSKKYGFPTFTANSYVFGLEDWSTLNTPIVVEGEFDAMNLIQMGYGAVSINGSNPSKNQIKTLKDFNRILLMLDPDAAGRAAEGFIIRKMVKTHPDSLVAHLTRCDPGDSDVSEINFAISKAKTFVRSY